MESSPVIVRYDGIYSGMDGDNLAFTFLSHFIGTDGRDYYRSSWIGITSLLRTGVNLDNVQIISKGDK